MLLLDLDRAGLDELALLDAQDGEGGAQQAELARLPGGGGGGASAAPAAASDAEFDGAYVCRVSGGVRFATLDEFRAHCRSDWYRYNLKRRTKSLPPVGEEQFDALVDGGADLDEISGSDESDDEDEREAPSAQRDGKTPVVTFRHRPSGMLVSAWRCVLAPGPPPPAGAPALEGAPSPLAALGESVRQLASGGHWLVLLSRGGHFAAVVVRFIPLKHPSKPDAAGQLPSRPGCQLAVVAHKSLHRYVTRRKAGGRQSTADGAKSIKSAGSSLRRHNETMLTQEIRECLAGWSKEYVRTARLIFFQAPGPANAAALFGGGADAPLSRADPRIRSIPFITNRPTLSEATRAAQRLAHVDVHAPAPAAEPPAPRVRPPKPADARAGGRGGATVAAAEEEAPAQAPEPLPPSELHQASLDGDAEAVAVLLAAGADPTTRHPSFMRKVAYELAESREVRNAFRRRMAEAPEQWDWRAAKVPSALTEELEAAKADKDKSRERERKKRREREKKEAKAAQQQAAAELVGALAGACAGTDADAIEALVTRAAELAVDAEAARSRLAELRAQQDAFADPLARRRREAEARAAALERRLGLAGTAGGPPAAGAGGAAEPAAARCDWCGKLLPAQAFNRHVFRYCTTACVQAHSKTL